MEKKKNPLVTDSLERNNKPKWIISAHAEFKEPAEKLVHSSTIQSLSSQYSSVYS